MGKLNLTNHKGNDSEVNLTQFKKEILHLLQVVSKHFVADIVSTYFQVLLIRVFRFKKNILALSRSA